MSTTSPTASARKKALVTGASSGIGAAFAEQLAAAGYDLILVARRRERLEAAAERLPVDVEPLPADLADPAGLHRVVERAGAGDLDLIVSNAGVGGYQRLDELDLAQVQGLLTLNALTPVLLARAALPHLLERGSGGVITVASLLAFSAGNPTYQFPRTLYVAAKAATVAFTRQLATEVAGTGVTATVVCPGLVDSEWSNGANHDNPAAMTPANVARAALNAHRRRETICIPGLANLDNLDRFQAAETALLTDGSTAHLAARYLT